MIANFVLKYIIVFIITFSWFDQLQAQNKLNHTSNQNLEDGRKFCFKIPKDIISGTNTAKIENFNFQQISDTSFKIRFTLSPSYDEEVSIVKNGVISPQCSEINRILKNDLIEMNSVYLSNRNLQMEVIFILRRSSINVSVLYLRASYDSKNRTNHLIYIIFFKGSNPSEVLSTNQSKMTMDKKDSMNLTSTKNNSFEQFETNNIRSQPGNTNPSIKGANVPEDISKGEHTGAASNKQHDSLTDKNISTLYAPAPTLASAPAPSPIPSPVPNPTQPLSPASVQSPTLSKPILVPSTPRVTLLENNNDCYTIRFILPKSVTSTQSKPVIVSQCSFSLVSENSFRVIFATSNIAVVHPFLQLLVTDIQKMIPDLKVQLKRSNLTTYIYDYLFVPSNSQVIEKFSIEVSDSFELCNTYEITLKVRKLYNKSNLEKIKVNDVFDTMINHLYKYWEVSNPQNLVVKTETLKYFASLQESSLYGKYLLANLYFQQSDFQSASLVYRKYFLNEQSKFPEVKLNYFICREKLTLINNWTMDSIKCNCAILHDYLIKLNENTNTKTSFDSTLSYYNFHCPSIYKSLLVSVQFYTNNTTKSIDPVINTLTNIAHEVPECNIQLITNEKKAILQKCPSNNFSISQISEASKNSKNVMKIYQNSTLAATRPLDLFEENAFINFFKQTIKSINQNK
jgi:hypothetical protein